MKSAKEFLESGDYLPPFLKDFHDQKLLFKYLDYAVIGAKQKSPDDYLAKDLPHWMVAQIYVISFFLWILARHGWTLQRSRCQVDDFEDLDNSLLEFDKHLMAVQKEMLMCQAERVE